MKNLHFIGVISILGLIILSLVMWIVSKFLIINLKVSEKYEELDFSKDIAKAEKLAEVSLVFFLILTVIYIGVLIAPKIR